MKKQINPTIKAHLIRSAFYVILLLAVCVIPFALAQRNTTRHSVTEPKATAKLAAAGKQTGAPASAGAAGTVLAQPQPKAPAVQRALPFDFRPLPPNAPKFPYSSIRDPGTPSTARPTGTAKRVSQAPVASSGRTRVPTFLRQPKAPQVVLYDQYDNDLNNGIVSQIRLDAPTLSAETADNFVVPGGETWTITEVDVRSPVSLSSPALFDVHFYTDSAGFPGTEVYVALGLAVVGNPDYTVILTTPAVLGPGTYWVSVVGTVTGDQWFWEGRSVTSNGFSTAWRNPENGYGTGCTDWGRLETCIGIPWPDQMFRLVGTTGGGGTPTPTPTPTPSPTCTPGAGGLLIGSGMTTGYLPNGWEPTLASNTVNYTFSNSQTAPNEFALFDTHDPWGFTVVKDAITSNGHTFTEFTPAQLAGFNFADYRVIILNWDDTVSTDFVADYTAAIPALEAYINAGGVVWVTAAIQSCDSIPMPFGGQGNGCDFGNNDPVVDPGNPMMVGMPNPIPGNSASHLSFSGLPGLAHVVVTSDASGLPALYELFPGGGGCTPTPTPTPTPSPTCTPSGGWSEVAPYPFAARGPFVVSDGTSYYVGGGYDGSSVHNELFLYDPVANTYTPLAGAPDTFFLSQAVIFNNKIYSIAGFTLGAQTTTTRIYDIASNSWTTGTPIPEPNGLSDEATGLDSGKIYIACGLINGSTATNTLRIYDIATDSWTTGANAPTAVFLPGFGVINGKLYVASGNNGAAEVPDLQIYDIATDTWSSGAPIPTPVTGPGSAVFDDGTGPKLYIFGGAAPFPTTTTITQIYDPATNTWSAGPSMVVPRLWFYGGALNPTSILAPGGDNSPGIPINDNEILSAGGGGCTPTPTPTVTPASPTPTPTPISPTPTATATATSTPASPTPTATATATATTPPGSPTPTATATATTTPRPPPTPRPRPTPYPRPTP